MNWQSVSFDWNQAKAFLATVEEGSLSAAAAALGVTQPTVGRQIAALEAELAVVLFDRGGRSLSLTPSGLELFEHVKAMANAASLVSLSASGQSQSIEGQVSITAPEGLSCYLLPPILDGLRQLAPEIEVEIIASNHLQDLRKREADIAIRHVRPEQPDLIARHIRTTTGHIYGASSYLERNGRPETVSDLAKFDFIAFEDVDRTMAFLNAFGLRLERSNFKLASNSSVALWEMLKLGLGLSVSPRDLGEITSGVEAVLPDAVSADVPIWLATHRELRTSRRIRLVFDYLAEALA